MPRLNLFPCLLISLALGCAAGCGPAPFAPDPPPPPLVTITAVSDPTPALRDPVSITWRYSHDDDPNIAPKMARQIVQLHSMTLDGTAFTQTQGCLPDELLGGQAPQPCLDTNVRTSEFDFQGPVMFGLVVVDDNGRIIEKLIKFTIPGASFRVNASTQGFLDAALQSSPTSNLPRFGGGAGISSINDMLFERAFGIFEIPDADGNEDIAIDQLQTDPILSQLFSADNPFLLTMTPNIDEQQEGDRFFFVSNHGRNFPILESDFLFNTPDGPQFQGRRTHADAIIFAGTLTASGTIERVGGRNGEAEVITPTLHSFETVFVQIDIRSTDGNPQQFIISDIHFGNVNQGLVFSTFRFHVSTQEPGTRGEMEHSINTAQIPLLSTGSIKGAVTGFNVRLTNGDNYTPAQAQISVDWSNIPMFPDNDISGLRDTYIRFSP